MRYLLISVVGGVHVAVIGGVLLMQGCGTTRGPVALPESVPMPPAMAEEDILPPARPVTSYKPATIDAAVSAARPAESSVPGYPAVPVTVKPVPATDDLRTYVVGKGDSLSVIAKRHGVSVTDLMLLNNISDPNRIRLGQKIKLPAAAGVKTPAVPKPDAAAPSAASAGSGRYEVKSGDSLSVIAHRHGTTVKALQDVNALTTDRIMVGQKLVLPADARTPVASAAQAPVKPSPTPKASPTPKETSTLTSPPIQTVERPAVSVPGLPMGSLAPDPAPASVPSSRSSYTVQVGDDILTVASVYNVSISELRRVNQLTSDTLIPGQTLIIPAAE